MTFERVIALTVLMYVALLVFVWVQIRGMERQDGMVTKNAPSASRAEFSE